jgi:hypothetical protein
VDSWRRLWMLDSEDYGGETTFRGQFRFHLLHHKKHWMTMLLVVFMILVVIAYWGGPSCPHDWPGLRSDICHKVNLIRRS